MDVKFEPLVMLLTILPASGCLCFASISINRYKMYCIISCFKLLLKNILFIITRLKKRKVICPKI